ncbi:MAG: ribbon-helix-helix protein, CopG family [Acidimicrobiaceae bacterium]|nr:ribbon-helix-helix protein, CopG family [Acidimicrobiaceae bacterium]MXZ97560.1 ribbon-helix-helix protein, CopG family [Acidimicrobiaceae bacterium]MYE75189.1 ribbon-helix-helix protein, CopG family [Acidimicrobiaceae bacterium]MYE96135.1 ribbon-helix-helix protein, CopG family [Acidimicrobiaceae bacterium]MYH43118.1 ribbon-helix-helix protein, CopG family [Acidimicrobiaceae bacterium]
MKVSVSIPEGDVEFLDAYARCHGIDSRSAALRRAIKLLRASELSQHYADAFAEWAQDGEEKVWDAVVGDGLGED